MIPDNTQALARYNNLFNNQQYQAIAGQLAIDLRLERDSMRVSDILNEVTNVALSLVGHSNYGDAWVKLALICGQGGISIVAINMIYNYLQTYQQPTDTRADDFQMTAKCLMKAYEATDTLRVAVSCANAVHGWRGRMAYDLLAASDYLTQAAIQLLSDGNVSYICEKLQHGIRRITSALHEGLRYSKRPNLFNFSNTHFPAE